MCFLWLKLLFIFPAMIFNFMKILAPLWKKSYFSLLWSDIFDWSHDWSTIQFSQFTGQISVKPILPIPHPR